MFLIMEFCHLAGDLLLLDLRSSHSACSPMLGNVFLSLGFHVDAVSGTQFHSHEG